MDYEDDYLAGWAAYEDANYCDDGWSVEVAAARYEGDLLNLQDFDWATEYDAALNPAAPAVAAPVAALEDTEPF